MKQLNETISLFVPGRLCLFGEHSDWAGLHRIMNAEIIPGAAIVTGIEQGIYAEAEKCERFVMNNKSSELKEVWTDFDCTMQTKELRSIAESGNYFSYAAGVASYMKDYYTVGGVKITITKMTLPTKKGLSSSAAICVLVARAFNYLYGLNLNTKGEMDIAFKGEQRTLSRCGRLDQACAYGVAPVGMRFDGDEITTERLVVKGNFYWVFADLNSKKDTIKILNDLNKCYPFAETEKDKKVHEALGIINQNIVEKATQFLRIGDAPELGQLMTEAQKIFDTMVAPASIEELAAPKLHTFLQDEVIKSLTYGGKGVGSQGDGSIQFLAKNAAAQEDLCEYLKHKGLNPYQLTLKTQHRIRKAIIPIAGFGTRLYPATRRIKKEMLPLIDKDGMLKPVLLILLEQIINAGIDEICLVVRDEDEIHYYQDFFNTPLENEHFDKLSTTGQNYEQTLKAIGAKLAFRIQHEHCGFGHAVYQCHDFTAGEPVLLLLGDTIYTSNERYNCTRQLIDIYEELEKPLIAISRIPADQTCNHGVLAGNWTDTSHRKMDITAFVEKPERDYAKKNLSMSGVKNIEEYYAVFGQYILPPEIFDTLKEQIESKKSSISEINMTYALNTFIGHGLTGVVLNGNMYDMGNTIAYRETFNLFGNPQ